MNGSRRREKRREADATTTEERGRKQYVERRKQRRASSGRGMTGEPDKVLRRRRRETGVGGERARIAMEMDGGRGAGQRRDGVGKKGNINGEWVEGTT